MTPASILIPKRWQNNAKIFLFTYCDLYSHSTNNKVIWNTAIF